MPPRLKSWFALALIRQSLRSRYSSIVAIGSMGWVAEVVRSVVWGELEVAVAEVAVAEVVREVLLGAMVRAVVMKLTIGPKITSMALTYV